MKNILAIQIFLFSSASVIFIIAQYIFFSTKNPLLSGNDTSIGFVLTPGMFLVFWIFGVVWRALIFSSVQRRSRLTQPLLTADMILGIWNTLFLLVLFQGRIFSEMMYFLAVSAAFGSLVLKMICFMAERRLHYRANSINT